MNSYARNIQGWLDNSDNSLSLSKLVVIAFFFIFVILSVAIVALIYTLSMDSYSDEVARVNPFEIMGPLGDFVGGILNPVLTFIMFMSVLVTILIQSNELKETGIEIRRQAESHEQYIKILKTEQTREQLRQVFNESRDRFWELSKEKILAGPSIYDWAMNGDSIPESKYVQMQLEYMKRTLDSITEVAGILLPNISRAAAKVLFSDLEYTYSFSRSINIVSDDEIKEKLSYIESKLNPAKVGLLTRLWKGLFGNQERKK